jgi:hypothetical protein
MDNMDRETSSNAVMPIAGTSGNAGMLQNVGMTGNAGMSVIPTDGVLLVLPCSKEVSVWE